MTPINKQILSLICLLIGMTIFTEAQNFSSTEITINRYVDGTLLIPESIENPPLVILIAGSGPTDRDGNQSFMKNDMLKKLAEELTKNGGRNFQIRQTRCKTTQNKNF